MRFRVAFLIVPVLAVFTTGCGRGTDPALANRPKTFPVSGAVSYKGKPFEGAQINFVPAASGSPAAYAVSQADGKFTLSTFGSGDGAPAGTYKVTVTRKTVETILNPKDPSAPPQGSKEVSLLPDKYGKVSTTPIEVTISEGGKKGVPLDLVD